MLPGLAGYEGAVRQLLISYAFLSFLFFLHNWFGEVKLTDHLGGCQMHSLFDVGLSKPDKPEFIQHTFIRYRLCAGQRAKQPEIQPWAQTPCHGLYSLGGERETVSGDLVDTRGTVTLMSATKG